MEEKLKKKLDEAQQRLTNKQEGINTNREHRDKVFREWARGEQAVVNNERETFKGSFTDEERRQIEQRMEELLNEHPELSPHSVKPLDGSDAPVFDTKIIEEYFFLRELLS